jgi:hypothetical protein
MITAHKTTVVTLTMPMDQLSVLCHALSVAATRLGSTDDNAHDPIKAEAITALRNAIVEASNKGREE